MKKSIILLTILLLGSSVICMSMRSKEDIESSLNVPFKFYFNEILFQACINNSEPLWFILDSGVSDFIINENTADELELPLGEVVDQGYSGIGEERISETEVKEINFKIKNSEIHLNSGIFTWTFKSIETVMGHRIDGVCGHHLFERYVVEIDYKKKIFNLYDPKKYQYKGSGKEIPLFIDGVPYTKATVIFNNNERFEANFMIDTGLHDALSFTSIFCRENNLYEEIGRSVKSIRIGGGGSSENRVGRIKAVIIGGYKLDNPIAALSNDTKGGMASQNFAGLIGNEILKNFKVIFDYSNNRMILEPSDSFNDEMEWDMSGLFLYANGERFEQINVYKVLPGSPAESAGIQAGDKIIHIDGKDTVNFSIDEIVRMFKHNGKQYMLGILRDNKKIEVKIILQKMV